MRSNFVVSAYRNIWISGSKAIFVPNPYILHVLRRDEMTSAYENIEVAIVRRKNQEEFQRDHDFVDLKFRKYRDILSARLDEIHGTDYEDTFWNKVLSLSLLRHITHCYELFLECEENFSPSKHDCLLLANNSFKTPFDFDAHRNYFLDSDLGREQLFSVYCQLFHPGFFNFFQPPKSSGIAFRRILKIKNKINDLRGRINLRKITTKLKLLSKQVISSKLGLINLEEIQVGILDCSFRHESIGVLVDQSKGRIRPIVRPKVKNSSKDLNLIQRKLLSRIDPSSDRFDRFFFATLEHSMPRLYVEDFSQNYNKFYSYFKPYSGLRWVVCEWWIGSALSSFALAVLGRLGVKHISAEHNYISHCFVGANYKYLAPLADEYLTLGWRDPQYSNIVQGSSLYEWTDASFGERNKKEHDILFLMTAPIAYLAEMSAAYGGQDGAFGAITYFDWNRRFLTELGDDVLKDLYIRAYPLRALKNWLVWDAAFELKSFIYKAKFFDNNQPISSKSLISKSRLVIVNYTATSYLESIMSNVPTIFFLPKNCKFLNEKYKNIFKELIEVGICQTSPEDAAKFVRSIRDNPEEWWGSQRVKICKDRFLEENIKKPVILINYLLKKVS